MDQLFEIGYFFAALGWSILAVAAALTITWVVGSKTGRYSIIDIMWGPSFALIAVISYAMATNLGDPTRKLLLLILTCAWAIRLSIFIACRQSKTGEDHRYTAFLHASTHKKNKWAMLYRVYALQALAIIVVGAIQIFGIFAPGPSNWMTWTGAAIFTCGFIFETIADAQLAHFKSKPHNNGQILTTGLWAWTRHPNYFGEATLWWGLFLITASSWPGILTLLSPMLMTGLLVSYSGIPLTEKRLHPRPKYAEYAARTSAFFPLPPKKTRLHGDVPTSP